MMTKYIQNGESLDYLNTTGKKISAGDILGLVTRIGVAGCDIAPDEVGSVTVTGVFEMPKSVKTSIPMGTPLFFDGVGITDIGESSVEAKNTEEESADAETSSIPAGYAAASAAADATWIRVKLLG